MFDDAIYTKRDNGEPATMPYWRHRQLLHRQRQIIHRLIVVVGVLAVLLVAAIIKGV